MGKALQKLRKTGDVLQSCRNGTDGGKAASERFKLKAVIPEKPSVFKENFAFLSRKRKGYGEKKLLGLSGAAAFQLFINKALVRGVLVDYEEFVGKLGKYLCMVRLADNAEIRNRCFLLRGGYVKRKLCLVSRGMICRILLHCKGNRRFFVGAECG